MSELPIVARGTFLVIRTDGSEETFPLPTVSKSGERLALIERAMNADAVDVVAIGKLQHSDLVMLVNDRGYDVEAVHHGSDGKHDFVTELKPVRALLPVNAKATALYHAICVPGTTHQIVGDVAILHDGD